MHQLDEKRASQGELVTSQLITDSLTELDPPNTVFLASLVNRYATDPNIASIRILSTDNQVIATAGQAKTREGEIFIREAIVNDKSVGSVEVTLIKPSAGEILRSLWATVLASFVMYVFLWLAYRLVARPSRAEYLERINTEKRLKQEIQELNQALEQEKRNAAIVISQAQHPHEIQEPIINIEKIENDHTLSLAIEFYDPRQLLHSIDQSIALPYFNLYQICLNKSIDQICPQYQLTAQDIVITHTFNASGTIISIDANKPNAAQCLAMINTSFQLLSEVLYKRYRQDKRFALQTRTAISSAVPAMRLSSVEAAQRLLYPLIAKESAIHLPKTEIEQLSQNYELVRLQNANNALTRNAFKINGSTQEIIDLAQNIRSEVLRSKAA